MIYPLHAGNALRLILMPPSGVTRLRVLRKPVGTFDSAEDDQAVVVYDGEPCQSITDFRAVPNGPTLHYSAFYLDGSRWIQGGIKSAQAGVRFADASVDVVSILRDRIDLGLRPYVARGALKHRSGHIPILTASPLFEETPLPVITLHVDDDSPGEVFVGDELMDVGGIGDDGMGHSLDGYLSRYQIKVVAWSLNADEREVLRKAIKAICLANGPVFEDAGIVQRSVSASNQEDFTTYAAPVYQAVIRLNCLAPSALDRSDSIVTEVTLQHNLPE